MQKKYDHQIIEQKWQKEWTRENLYQTGDESDQRPKYYVLDMFPYPSGAGLHVGHPKGYIATDILARRKMMSGVNVLHPMGWDAFGLPAENYAMKMGRKPAELTAENIELFKKQLDMLGIAYDWDREVNTTDPDFYKWTQWCFLQFWGHYYDQEAGCAKAIEELIVAKFGPEANYYDLTDEQKGEIDNERLAFESWEPINWCPTCQTGLANEDLENGLCERCGSQVERKPMRQWVIRITKYADRMLNDLELLPDWENSTKVMQRNWIGRKEGIDITYRVEAAKEDEFEKSTKSPNAVNVDFEKGPQKVPENMEVKCFTTRPDTNFGATFVVTAPDSEFVKKNMQFFPETEKVAAYVAEAVNKSELDRIADGRKKTGVFTGWVAINELNGRRMPIYVADFVLGNFGTGNVVGVPGHDLRDFEFAETMGLPVVRVVVGNDGDRSDIVRAEQVQEDEGTMVNSEFLDGVEIHEAKKLIMDYLEKRHWGQRIVNYKIQDWVFSRQRYWGEPIPMIHCPKCGVVPVPEAELPVKLPDVEKYQPSGTGESPLIKIRDWVEVPCPRCGEMGERETNTMPQWAGSSWYYLRYCDPKNDQELISQAKDEYWNPVDFYVGGAEHATRHLIYARFWHKFLYDLKIVSHVEPFTRLQHVGLIIAEDGRKMSKRWGNVINPDDVVEKYGADSMRIYEMFMSPFGQTSMWNMQGVGGVRKFLEKVWSLQEKVTENAEDEARKKYELLLNQTIQQVGNDINGFKFNTAVSAMMILVNKMMEEEVKEIAQQDYEKLILILSPFAPHMMEEIWHRLGHQGYILRHDWPEVDEKVLLAAQVKVMLQINGKLRGELVLTPEEAEDESLVLEKAKMELQNTKKLKEEMTIFKEIYVPKKIVNLVVKTG